MEDKTVKDFIKHTDRNRELNQIAKQIKNGGWKEELGDIINREVFKEDLVIQIKNLVEQELDKAREETRQEERDMFIVRYATVSFNEVIKTIKTLSIIEFLSIKWGLKGKKKSKLNK